MHNTGFNVEKCKFMHIGSSNLESEYKMRGKNYTKTKDEKDVPIRSNLKPTKQCKKAATKAT
jgi:hypothetical protein